MRHIYFYLLLIFFLSVVTIFILDHFEVIDIYEVQSIEHSGRIIPLSPKIRDLDENGLEVRPLRQIPDEFIEEGQGRFWLGMDSEPHYVESE